LIFLLAIIILLFKINSDYLYFDYSNINSFSGIITDIYGDEEKIILELENEIKIRATYYYKEANDLSLGDNVTIYGEFSIPQDSTNFNLFSYKNYLKSKDIYYIFNINSLRKNNNNKNIFYDIKNFLISIINSNASYKYLHTFILGDNRYLDSTIKTNYQFLGISHLFSISGMHISIFSSIILFILKKLGVLENTRYIICCIFIFFYMFLVNYCPSVLRSGIFFVFITINNIFYLNIKPINLLLLTISIIIMINPFIIYNSGFLYSSIITSSLILFSSLINNYDNYFAKLFFTSIIAFFFSFPISIYNYYQINLLTVFYNLIFVPIISIIIFPLSLICLFCPFLSSVFNFLVGIVEFFSIKLALINSNIILIKPNLFVVFSYYILIYLIFKFKNKLLFCFLLGFLLIHYNYNIIFQSDYVLIVDVGQGDSILLHSGKYNVLLDTGGNSYSESFLAKNVLIPSLKSFGIKKIDYFLLSHGDYDHMGEAINLVENFKVEKVIFNCGEFNELEQDLIKVLEKKKIPYYSCIKELNIDDEKLYFLNSGDYGNENDNSSVIYTELNNHKFLFMGDASVEVEEDLIEKYNLQNIDILKVGHHGSKTSSSKKFINEVNPKYSIISVGKNNRYGHPNDNALEILENSKIYRTDQDGSIMFKINNNKLNIETCAT